MQNKVLSRRKKSKAAIIAAAALMAALVAVSALAQAVIIAPAVAVFYPDVNVGIFTASVLGNGIAFPLGFSIPLVILMQEELGFVPLR